MKTVSSAAYLVSTLPFAFSILCPLGCSKPTAALQEPAKTAIPVAQLGNVEGGGKNVVHFPLTPEEIARREADAADWREFKPFKDAWGQDVYFRDDLDAGVKALESGLSLHLSPGFDRSGNVKMDLAMTLVESGRYSEAIPYLEHIRPFGWVSPNPKLWLAVCYAETGNMEKAKRLFPIDKAVAINILYGGSKEGYLAEIKGAHEDAAYLGELHRAVLDEGLESNAVCVRECDRILKYLPRSYETHTNKANFLSHLADDFRRQGQFVKGAQKQADAVDEEAKAVAMGSHFDDGSNILKDPSFMAKVRYYRGLGHMP
jgi:hypothetical protein